MSSVNSKDTIILAHILYMGAANLSFALQAVRPLLAFDYNTNCTLINEISFWGSQLFVWGGHLYDVFYCSFDAFAEEGLCLGPKWTLELAQKCLNNHELELTTAGRRLLKMMCRTEDTSLAKAQGESYNYSRMNGECYRRTLASE